MDGLVVHVFYSVIVLHRQTKRCLSPQKEHEAAMLVISPHHLKETLGWYVVATS